MSLDNLFSKLKGNSRSGNYGHSGRLGKRGGSSPKGFSLSSSNIEFLLKGSEEAERSVSVSTTGKVTEIVGTKGEVESLDNEVINYHTHRASSEEVGGYPKLSASDIRNSIEKALKYGNHVTNAINPQTKKVSSIKVSYDGSDSHKEFMDLALRFTADLPGMVGHAKEFPKAFIDEGQKRNVFQFSKEILI